MRLFRPRFRFRQVVDIQPAWLRDHGFTALLLDVDCTLKRYGETELPREVVAWLRSILSAEIHACLVSNGLRRRIEPLAIKYGLPVVARALKPLPTGCWRAMHRLDARRRHTAMIGDQLFADVMAGNLAGVATILVDPIHPEEEPWFTRLKRPLESWFVRSVGFDA